jgi:predicted benzoate:H+ symporter BenE
VAPAVLLWGWFTEFDTVWWLINGSLGAAYLAAIMVRFDGDDD